MELDDLELCYLFIRTSGNITKEKEKAFEAVKKNAKFSDYELEKFDTVCKFFCKTEKDALRSLRSMLPKSKKKKNNWLDDLFDHTYEAEVRRNPARARNLLNILIHISCETKERSQYDIDFINDFAERMKIDESYIHEFEDICETEYILNAMRDGIKNVGYSESETDRIIEQNNADLKTLETDVSDLIALG